MEAGDIDFDSDSVPLLEQYYSRLLGELSHWMDEFSTYTRRLGGRDELQNTLIEAFVQVAQAQVQDPGVAIKPIIKKYILQIIRPTYREVKSRQDGVAEQDADRN